MSTTPTTDVIFDTHYNGDDITIMILSISIGFCLFICLGSCCVLYRKLKSEQRSRDNKIDIKYDIFLSNLIPNTVAFLRPVLEQSLVMSTLQRIKKL